MVAPVLNTPVKSLGIDTYSVLNMPILKENIENALKEGFRATFMSDPGDFGEDIINNFAKAAATPMTIAIDSYIKGMLKSQNIIITPTTLFASTVPAPALVTGAMSTMTDIQIS